MDHLTPSQMYVTKPLVYVYDYFVGWEEFRKACDLNYNYSVILFGKSWRLKEFPTWKLGLNYTVLHLESYG